MAKESVEVEGILMRSPRDVRFQLRLAHDNGGGLTARGKAPPTPQMLGLLNGKLQEIFEGDAGQRISLLRWLWGIEGSSKELTFGQVKVTLDWLIDKEASQREMSYGGTYVVSERASKECHAIIAHYCEEKGQMRLFG